MERNYATHYPRFGDVHYQSVHEVDFDTSFELGDLRFQPSLLML